MTHLPCLSPHVVHMSMNIHEVVEVDKEAGLLFLGLEQREIDIL